MLPSEFDQTDAVIWANVVVEYLNDSSIHLLGILWSQRVDLIDKEDEVSWSLNVRDERKVKLWVSD